MKTIKFYVVENYDRTLRFSSIKKFKQWQKPEIEKFLKEKTNEEGLFPIKIKEQLGYGYSPMKYQDTFGKDPKIVETKYGFKVVFKEIIAKVYTEEKIYEPEVKIPGKPYKPERREIIKKYIGNPSICYDVIEEIHICGEPSIKTRIRFASKNYCEREKRFGEKVVPSHENFEMDFECWEEVIEMNGDELLEGGE